MFQFWRREPRNSHLIRLFDREHGPICYETVLVQDITDNALRVNLPNLLLSSGLQWYWESWRRGETAPDSPVQGLPRLRPMTALTAITKSDLLDDLQERDVDGEDRYMSFLGFSSEMSVLEFSELFPYLVDFSEHEAGPLQIALVQSGDELVTFIFVPHIVSDEVRALMDRWHVDPQAPMRKYSYKNVDPLTFEKVFLTPKPPPL